MNIAQNIQINPTNHKGSSVKSKYPIRAILERIQNDLWKIKRETNNPQTELSFK